jgi:feruloyl-CoA synthase
MDGEGLLFAAPEVAAERRVDGTWLLRSTAALGRHDVTVLDSLRRWAAADPVYPLIAERAGQGWRTRSYGEVEHAARAAGQGLLELGLGPDRPLLILSGNSVDHLVVSLAAMTAGVPVVPVSAAYSLQSRDHARIREIAALVAPGAVFAADPAAFGPALSAVGDVPVIGGGAGPGGGTRPTRGAGEAGGGAGQPGSAGVTWLAELEAVAPGAAVDAARAALRPGSLAKILFTSGSTGAPKGVLNTHGMLAANQQMIAQAWPFLREERPVVVDWLPWSHTFGGNHNVGLILTAGGTLYVDGGRPAPGLFAQTRANLAGVPPTIYFNVPAGYAQLVPELEADPEFARRFFSRLRLIFNAAAALPAGLRQRLADVAARSSDRAIPVTASWGLTETAPAVTSAHFAYTDPACIGVPLPGAEVKLSPAGDSYEIRARGPMVTPGYFGRPDLTAQAFDDEGYYRTGDAARLLDEDHPERGLVFRGRLAEDFKLSTGTFVRVGAVRTALLSAIPLLADAVIAGEGRDFAAALAWLNAAQVRQVLGGDRAAAGGGGGLAAGGGPGGGEADVVTDPAVLAHLAAGLAAHQPEGGSASRVERLLVLTEPPSLDGGEITDKGYLNQRRILQLRAALVDRLFAEPKGPGVVTRSGLADRP